MVTTSADRVGQGCGPNCALREAIATPACDEIIFSQTLTFTSLVLTFGQLNINRPMSIVGLGSTAFGISGNGSSRIFYITAPARIFGITLAGGGGNGIGGGPGGAVATGPGGSLTLDNVYFKDNFATGTDAAGVYLQSGVNIIRNSTFAANTTTGTGGGVVLEGGNLSIINSTFTNNTASDGGAIHLKNGIAVIRSTTIRANTGVGNVLVSGTATLNFGNSIIDTVLRTSKTSAVLSAGNNLLSISRNDVGQPVIYHGSDMFNPNASILPLNEGASGNFPPTMGLPNEHPAIDSGNNSLVVELPLNYDQRALYRVFDGNADGIPIVDIGSVEAQPATGPLGGPVLFSGRIIDSNGRPVTHVLINVTFPDSTQPPISTTTNPIGNYYFRSISHHYATISIYSKRGTACPRTISTIHTQENIDFIVQ